MIESNGIHIRLVDKFDIFLLDFVTFHFRNISATNLVWPVIS